MNEEPIASFVASIASVNDFASCADLNALTPISEYFSANASIASDAVSYSPDLLDNSDVSYR